MEKKIEDMGSLKNQFNKESFKNLDPIEYIAAKRAFIESKGFRALEETSNSQKNSLLIQESIKRYKNDLDSLEAYINDDLLGLLYEKLEKKVYKGWSNKERKYPLKLELLRGALNTTGVCLVGGALFFGVASYYGGNPAFWSPLVKYIGLGVGVLGAIPASIGISIGLRKIPFVNKSLVKAHKKMYDRVMSKEKTRISSREISKTSFNNAMLDISNQINCFLCDKENDFIDKDGNLSEEYSSFLSKAQQRKLLTVLSNLDQRKKTLDKSHASLQKIKNKIEGKLNEDANIIADKEKLSPKVETISTSDIPFSYSLIMGNTEEKDQTLNKTSKSKKKNKKKKSNNPRKR